MVLGARDASSAASSVTCADSASGSTMRVAKPSARASVASTSRPVSIKSRRRAGPTRSSRRTVFAIDRQLPSVRDTGMPNLARGEQTRMSQASAIRQPPPAATPSTSAMVGTGTRSSVSIIRSSRRS